MTGLLAFVSVWGILRFHRARKRDLSSPQTDLMVPLCQEEADQERNILISTSVHDITVPSKWLVDRSKLKVGQLISEGESDFPPVAREDPWLLIAKRFV